MKGTFQAKDPSEHEYTLTVTMTLEWIELKHQMTAQKYRSGQFRYLISDMIRQAEEVYFATSESPPESPDQTSP